MKSPWLAGEEGLQADQIKPVRDNVSAGGLGIQLIKQAENGKKKPKRPLQKLPPAANTFAWLFWWVDQQPSNSAISVGVGVGIGSWDRELG